MNGSLVCLFLYCVVIMGTAVLANDGNNPTGENFTTENGTLANPNATMGPSGTTELTKLDNSTNQISTKDFQSESTTPATLNTSETSGTNSPVNTNNTPPRANTKPTAYPPLEAKPSPGSYCLFEKNEGTILLMVTGGLVVLCTILLVSTVVLSCQVCHLKRRPRISSRPTRSNVDLVSGAAYLGIGQRTKERPDSEPSETSLMMAELKQTQEGERGKEDKEQGKNEMAKDTPKKDEKKEATENGVSGAANPSQGSPVTTTTTTTTKQPAEPSDPAATAVSPPSQASSDVVVVVG